MRHALPAVLLLLALTPPASACLNTYKKNIKGEGIEIDDENNQKENPLAALTNHVAHDFIRKADPGPAPAADADFKVRNDYAVKLIHRGEARKAIDILESAERGHPGESIVAANLGTAYELNGDVDKALTWIQEGITRDPKLHLGTEWLHVRILEVKRELAKDPNWLQTHTVLDFDFGKEAIPVFPAVWGKMGAERVTTALWYQLHERLAFVSPPDPIVGELLAVYADWVAMNKPVDQAIPLYDFALKFKPARADLIEKRRAQAASMEDSIFDDVPGLTWGMLATAAVAIALGVLLKIRKSRKLFPPRV
jgi:tetratricopeptide (TPR) repeat protein